MLRVSKKMSIVMAFCICLALVAPLVVAPQADASVGYSVLSTPILKANTAGQSLGTIQIDISNCAGIAAGDVLTISFSSEVDLTNGLAPTAGATAVVPGLVATPANKVDVVIPATVGGNTNALVPGSFSSAAITRTGTTLDLTFNATTWAAGASATDKGIILVYFNLVKIGSIDGEVSAMVMGPANSAFPTQTVVNGKVDDAGGTVATVKSVKSYGTSGGATDTFIISETVPGRLPVGDVVKFKLPAGYAWAGATGTWNWGWAADNGGVCAPVVNAADTRELQVTILSLTNNATKSGQFRFAGVITVDDTIAKEGEVVCHVSDKDSKVTEADIPVMNYVSYGVKVVEGTQKDIVAGKHDQKLGEFWIKENVKASLVNGRQIKLVLPKGVKWAGTYSSTAIAVPAPEKGNVTLAGVALASPYDTWKMSVASPAAASKSEFKFKDYRVDVAPDFVGPIKISVQGDAGVTGEVTVANVKPAVELKAEDVKNVRIGEQNQELGTLVITESKKENVSLNSQNIDTFPTALAIDIATQPGTIELILPGGAEWAAGYPKVEVTDGDLQLKVDQMSKSGATLTIPVKSESTKPSTIKVSGMKATLYRTVPEGDFKVAVGGTAINETGGSILIGAVNNNYAFAQFELNDVAVAKCVTPAPGEGTVGAVAGQFKIDSNIYYVNGAAKIMDAAPYVKAGRTYVPIRYLGYALGLTDANIVWDAAAQKATLTLGDKKVELTIGSTTITVNGEAKTMDVAPEINSDRTMLPARFVAEGLGFQVGWDAGTGTVLVSK